MNLNANQVIAILMVLLGVATASTAQLTDLLGPSTAHIVITIAGLLNSAIAGIMGVMTGQAGMIKSVAAMPGIDSIKVNAQANPTLAQIAVSNDPTAAKVEATPAAEAQVNQIAKGV